MKFWYDDKIFQFEVRYLVIILVTAECKMLISEKRASAYVYGFVTR